MRVGIRLENQMLDGKRDFEEFHDDQSVSSEGRDNIRELLARLDSLEKELGHFIRETLGEASCTGTTRVAGGD
jgi:hypothetical protein